MIVRLTPQNMFNFFGGISAITSVATIFGNKPDEDGIPATSYIYFDVRNSADTVAGNAGVLERRARITMYVVGPTSHATIPVEQIVENVIGTVDNAILPGTADLHKYLDSIYCDKIIEVRGGESPIGYTEKNRAIKSKDYEIVYGART